MLLSGISKGLGGAWPLRAPPFSPPLTRRGSCYPGTREQVRGKGTGNMESRAYTSLKPLAVFLSDFPFQIGPYFAVTPPIHSTHVRDQNKQVTRLEFPRQFVLSRVPLTTKSVDQGRVGHWQKVPVLVQKRLQSPDTIDILNSFTTMCTININYLFIYI
jgi:hypothetical protein